MFVVSWRVEGHTVFKYGLNSKERVGLKYKDSPNLLIQLLDILFVERLSEIPAVFHLK